MQSRKKHLQSGIFNAKLAKPHCQKYFTESQCHFSLVPDSFLLVPCFFLSPGAGQKSPIQIDSPKLGKKLYHIFANNPTNGTSSNLAKANFSNQFLRSQSIKYANFTCHTDTLQHFRLTFQENYQTANYFPYFIFFLTFNFNVQLNFFSIREKNLEI